MSNSKNENNIKEIIMNYSNEEIAEVATSVGKPWTGFRDLILVDKIEECEDIISFYFKSCDGEKLVKHKAGQYLPFRIKTDNEKYKDAIRTYSLSMKPNDDVYRISVKKVKGGLISSYLHEEMKVGDIIEAMVPAGLFTLNNENSEKPVVLLSAGIGITPLLSMLYSKLGDAKNLTFVQAVQNSNIQPFNKDIKMVKELNGLQSYVFYSDPLKSDVEGQDYDFTGFVGKEWIEKYLPLNADYYFCGPPIFMKNVNKALLALGVDKTNINFEFFGDPQSME